MRFRLESAFPAALLAGALSAGFYVASYYPGRIRTVVLLLMAALLAVSLWRTDLGLFLLLFLGPLFGNHPGGRFLEVFPLLLAMWVGLHMLREPRPPGGRLILFGAAFVVAQFLPVLFHPWPWQDSGHRQQDVFHVLSADEHNPLYVMQQMLWTTLLLLFALSSGEHLPSAAAGIAAGMIVTMGIGCLDMAIPSVSAFLDAYHVYVDGYVDRSSPHGIGNWLRFSPNSLFWNRSWHGIYIISALPFFSLAAMAFVPRFLPNRWWRMAAVFVALVLAAYLVLVGARGALLAFVVFVVALIPLLLLGLAEGASTARGWQQHRWRSLLLYWPVLVAGLALVAHVVVPVGVVLGNVGLGEPRFGQYAAALRIMLVFPFTGGGLESYGYYNTNMLQGMGLAAPHGTAHSQWLQILSGSGLVGGLAYVALLLWALLGPLRSLTQARLRLSQMSFPEGRPPEAGRTPSGAEGMIDVIRPFIVLAGLASMLVYSTVQEWWYLKPVQASWWLLVALGISMVPGARAGGSIGDRATQRRTIGKRVWVSADAVLSAVPGLAFVASVCLLLLAPLLYRHGIGDGETVGDVPVSHMVQLSTGTDGRVMIADLPTIPGPEPGPLRWYGVEYQGRGRFLVLEGMSWIELPGGVTAVRLEGAKKDGQLHVPQSLHGVRLACPTGKDVLLLRCSAASGLNDRQRDYDGRRHCAELIVPDAVGETTDLFARPLEGERHRFF